MVNLTQKQTKLPPTFPKRKDLPAMYDLPSEEVGESGLPDLFHPIQAELLEQTFQPSTYSSERVFAAMDLNIYYDENNMRRYKRPDWFGVVGVPRLYEERELRMSYVIWDEGIGPFIVVELLSPSTQREDLGQTLREANEPPTKWEVYEQFLRVPYYVVYSRERERFQAFHLENDRYQEIVLTNNKLQLDELGLRLGLWQGSHKRIERLWLRFYDASGNLIPTATEREQQQQQRAELAETALQETQNELQALRDRLRSMGLDPDNLSGNG